MLENYLTFYLRELETLKKEIESYSNENLLWKKTSGVQNSAGNLVLHLFGNLHHFIGAELGGSNYIRNREKEFSEQNISKKELLKMLEETIASIKQTFGKLNENDLTKNYPKEFLGKTVSIAYVLTQLLVHLNYHLGQINYHRRLLS